MIVCMTMREESWTRRYFTEVPTLLAEHGARQVMGGRSVELVEGNGPPPDRAAVFEFPDVAAAHRFMADPRYQPFLAERRAGSQSEIYLFTNTSGQRGLV